jgi:hypothetical protein
MLEIAIKSGHLKKTRGAASPHESLEDIFLTKSASELIQGFFDRAFCEKAIAEARKCVAEDDRLHPFVGAVVVKDGTILSTGYRCETGAGRHGEFCALKKINDDVDDPACGRSRETYNQLNAYFATVPGNYAMNLPQLYLLNTNYADLSFLFTILPGEKTKAHLGTEDLAVVETDNSTPYFLNLHTRDVAHTLILGMTGSGKSYLCASQ